MVSKTEYAEMLAFVDGLRDWIFAASACLESHERTFSSALSAWLNGAR